MYGYRSCPDCGMAVQAARLWDGAHKCPHERFIAHQLLRFERDFSLWLRTAEGRFMSFWARTAVR